jgi:phosphoribosyl-ATP pyrophosphohydrolase
MEKGQKVQSLVKQTAENESMQKCVKSELKRIIKKIESAQEPKTALKESMKNLLDTECADLIFQEISLEEFLSSDLENLDFLK